MIWFADLNCFYPPLLGDKDTAHSSGNSLSFTNQRSAA